MLSLQLLLTFFMLGCLLYFLGLSFFSVSLWILIFQSIFYLIIFFMLFFNFSELGESFKWAFKSFVGLYLILEVFVELIFILSYIFNWSLGFGVLGIFKLGIFPFFYYKYFLLGLNYKYFYVSIFTLTYFLTSKMWALLILSMFMFSYQNLEMLVIFALVTIFLNWDYSLKNLIFKSFIFSNLVMMLINMSLPMMILYILLSSYLQFKVLIKYDGNLFFEDYLKSLGYLTILNGNLVWGFNFMKTLVFMGVFNYLGLFLGFLLSLSVFMILFFSMNIFLKELLTTSFKDISTHMMLIFLYFILAISTCSFLDSFEWDLFPFLTSL